MATPAIGDIDGDGADEIIVSASYFFDADYYADPVRAGPENPRQLSSSTHRSA